MKKRIYAIWCAIVIGFVSIGVMLPTIDVQAEGRRTDAQGFVWDGTAIVGYEGNETEITIPKGATEIGDGAFRFNKQLTRVIIPEGVTSIEVYAFSYCSSLRAVTLPNSMLNLEFRAFEQCTELTEIFIPSNVKKISLSAFEGCRNLERIEIDKNNKVYDSRDNCNAIIETASNILYRGCNETVIPNSIKQISSEAFRGCGNLTNITIPEGITSIEHETFYGCSSLTDVTIPSSVTSISYFAFSGCESLKNISLPNSLITIGASAFFNCSSLTDITIPSSVTNIGASAFSNCSSLKSINIPYRLTTLGENVFYRCDGLESIQVDADNPKYDSRDGCNAIVQTENNTLIQGCKNSIICDSVTSIGKGAFSYCSGLASITIPNSVTSICNSAFYGCANLQEVTIPNSVTLVEGMAFANCAKLESIQVDADNPKYDSRDGCNAIVQTENNTLIQGCKNTKIPDSVTCIGNAAFAYCTGIKSFVVSNNITNIGNTAFAYCMNLKEITIPDSVINIGIDVFEGCRWGLPVVYCEPGSVAEEYANANNLDVQLHKCTMVEAKPATCIEDGNIEYYVCELCEKIFSDRGSTEIDKEIVKIPATGVHQNTELRNKKEATTTESGYTGDVYCADCGALITLGTEIPALGISDSNFTISASDIGEGALGVKIDMTADELREILPEADLQSLKEGNTIDVHLKVIKKVLCDEDRQFLGDKKGDYNIAENLCVDISLMKKVNNDDLVEMTDPLNGKMRISFKIPDELQNGDTTIVRSYKLLRIHQGEEEATEITGIYDATNGYFDFETDRFSTYVLVYKDTPKSDSNNQNQENGTDDKEKEDVHDSNLGNDGNESENAKTDDTIDNNRNETTTERREDGFNDLSVDIMETGETILMCQNEATTEISDTVLKNQKVDTDKTNDAKKTIVPKASKSGEHIDKKVVLYLFIMFVALIVGVGYLRIRKRK